MNTRICYTRKYLIALPLALAMLAAGCGKPPVNVNPTPSKYDRPTEVLNGVISSTRGIEQIAKNHHLSKRRAIASNAALTPLARKQQQIGETERFSRFNDSFKRANRYEGEAASTLKQITESGGSTQATLDKIHIVAGIITNELLANVDDPELRQTLEQLKRTIDQLIGMLTGDSGESVEWVRSRAAYSIAPVWYGQTVVIGPIPPKKGGN